MTNSLPAGFSTRKRYYAYSRFLKERFGTKVYRVTVDGGFTCPNVDGSVAVGGCVYCDNRSFSPNRRAPRKPIRDQVAHGIELLSQRYGAEQFLAYFQPATNTYAPVEKLRRLYLEALDHPSVHGLIVGTRPDCVPNDVLDLLDELARDRFVSLELGLQTIHDRSLDWMNRGHHHDAFLDAMERCQGRAFEIAVHVILGLPGETHADMMQTADVIAGLPIDAVKVHNLHVVRDTPLQEMFEAGTVRMLEFEEYVSLICDFLERIPAHVVMQRLNGDSPPSYLIAPTWCLDKPRLLNAIADELERRDSWQGKRCQAIDPLLPPRRRSLPIIDSASSLP